MSKVSKIKEIKKLLKEAQKREARFNICVFCGDEHEWQYVRGVRVVKSDCHQFKQVMVNLSPIVVDRRDNNQ